MSSTLQGKTETQAAPSPQAGAQAVATAKKETRREDQERTVPGRSYVPSTDIFEDANALYVLMDMPGVRREDVTVRLEQNKLSVEGRIDASAYQGLEPVYTEFNVGHFVRSFVVSHVIDQANIAAVMKDGVLTLTMPKVPEAQPRRITIH